VTPLARFLEEEIAAGSFPGASTLVARGDEVLAEEIAGNASLEPQTEAVTPDTLFDLASLTKPLSTGAILAASSGALPLDAAPGRYLPEWKRTRYEGITLAHLLTHTSGLPAWFPLYVRGEGPAAYRRALADLEPDEPPGRRVIYSDPNFLLLGEILEAALGAPLDRLFHETVASPAGSGARFLPGVGTDCAATEKSDRFERAMVAARGLAYVGFRDGVVRGEVHDGNAFRRGGVAGHAGLFGTARDVWKLALAWLSPKLVAYGADRTAELSEARGLSWQGKRGAGSGIPEMSPGSFGHTGFTGTSLWIDPARDWILVLLTNRIHPEVKEIPFNEVRQRFHHAAYESLG
jgi:CubicO group peptidase (beta-lactamase class C family)